MITVLRLAILSVLFTASVGAETLPQPAAPASTDAKSTDSTPAGTKPAGPKPAEIKPAQTEPKTAKPAAPAKPVALTFPTGAGNFHILVAQGKKTLDVFTYQPEGADATTPIVMVMTEGDRNAANARNEWITMANQYHLRVVVPKFSEQDFPGAAGYNLGNLVDPKTHRKLPASQWTFTVVDSLFSQMQKQGVTSQSQFYLFGNSAGCQVVHRMLTLLPQPEVKAAVCAAPTWWTLPDTDQRWPYGLRESPVSVNQQQLASYFAKPMLIAVGSEDDNPEAHPQRLSKQVMAQGSNRLDRAESYFTTSQQRAEQNNTPFNWHFVDLPDTGHSSSKMSVFAAGQFAWFEEHGQFHL